MSLSKLSPVRTLSRVMVVVFAMSAFFAVAGPAAAGVTTGAVNMRSGPGTRHAVLAVVPRGAGVAVRDCVTRRGWCRIEWRGRSGWISQRYLDASLPGLNMGPSSARRRGTTMTFELHVREDTRSPNDPDYGMSPPRRGNDGRPWLFGPDRQWRALQQRRSTIQYWLSD